jgi:hypothetical protein
MSDNDPEITQASKTKLCGFQLFLSNLLFSVLLFTMGCGLMYFNFGDITSRETTILWLSSIFVGMNRDR